LAVPGAALAQARKFPWRSASCLRDDRGVLRDPIADFMLTPECSVGGLDAGGALGLDDPRRQAGAGNVAIARLSVSPPSRATVSTTLSPLVGQRGQGAACGV
jgi:hypothetical protein